MGRLEQPAEIVLLLCVLSYSLTSTIPPVQFPTGMLDVCSAQTATHGETGEQLSMNA